MALKRRTAEQAHETRERIERDLERVLARSLRRFLARLSREAQEAARATALTAAASDDYPTLGTVYGWWVEEVDEAVLVALREAYRTVWHEVATGRITETSLDAAETYLGRVRDRLVRGLDYYGRTVFEWVTDKLGAQGTVCAGGRYDGLVSQFGGKPTPAVGFAMGVERLVLLLETLELLPPLPQGQADLYFCTFGEPAELAALRLSESLREALPGTRLWLNNGAGSFKSQFKKADKSGARFALVLGEDELARGVVACKPLRGQGEQQTLALDDLAGQLAALLNEI